MTVKEKGGGIFCTKSLIMPKLRDFSISHNHVCHCEHLKGAWQSLRKTRLLQLRFAMTLKISQFKYGLVRAVWNIALFVSGYIIFTSKPNNLLWQDSQVHSRKTSLLHHGVYILWADLPR